MLAMKTSPAADLCYSMVAAAMSKFGGETLYFSSSAIISLNSGALLASIQLASELANLSGSHRPRGGPVRLRAPSRRLPQRPCVPRAFAALAAAPMRSSMEM